jgi:hypothetical protein
MSTLNDGGDGTMGALPVQAFAEQTDADALANNWDAAISLFLFACRAKTFRLKPSTLMLTVFSNSPSSPKPVRKRLPLSTSGRSLRS